ncbi:MAG: type II secretion system GspH family protein [Gemmataceae bacterium]|nr:type II secretion system GspH family protein [Gemmataceae bacterium]
MRRTTRPAPRAAFTLIELLVVISILAILAAFVAGGIGMVRTAQMKKATEETMIKLQLALEGQWKSVADDASSRNKPPSSEVVAFCDGDPDRARSLWVYLNLKREFPQTFAEARNPTPPAPGVPGLTSIPARSTFAKLPNVVPANAVERRDQAAVLLYLILSEKSSKGSTFSADDVTQSAQGEVTVNGFTGRVFKDAWGGPVTFVRFTQTAELNRPPYTPAQAGANLFDSIDPGRKLWGTWTTAANKAQAESVFGAGFFTFDQANPDPTAGGRPIWNRRPTVASAGPDKDGQYPPAGDDDDILGYRLTRQGGGN